MPPSALLPLLVVLLGAPVSGQAAPKRAKPEPAPAPVERLSTPAGRGSMAPRLSGSGDAPLLSWVEPAGEGHRLLVSRLALDGWSEPVVAAEGSGWFVNWADTPGVVQAPDGRLWAHWLARAGEAPYAYHVMTAWSGDGGVTWSSERALHDDVSSTEHGFVSAAASVDALAAVWLDGRGMEAGGPMTLRSRVVGPRGPSGAEVVIDDRTCDCCPTSVASTSVGLIAAWRDRSEDEIRDIAVARRLDGTWEAPRIVAPDGWRMPGCPVNGPTIVSNGRKSVVLVWFTAEGEQARVQVATSQDAGETFDGRGVVSRQTLGRVTASAFPEGGAAIAWIEKGAEGEPSLTAARVESDGSVGGSVRVVAMSSARRSGMPRALTLTDGKVLFAWTDVFGDTTRVRTARVELPRP